jgi:hypothetical protein
VAAKKVTGKKMGRGKTPGRSAPKSPEKPLRLEVGKTYENSTGTLRVKIMRNATGPIYAKFGKVLEGLAITPFWTEAGQYFWTHKSARDLVREVPTGAKRPRAASAKGSK